MRYRRLGMAAGVIAAAAGLVVATPAGASTRIPFVNTNVDMTTVVNTPVGPQKAWVINRGGNIPYHIVFTAANDFSEVGCVSAGGKDWCRLEDNLGDCMNAPGSGTYAGFVVPSSCVANFTPEEWARTAVSGGWTEENRHFGTLINTDYNSMELFLSSRGAIWNFPAS